MASDWMLREINNLRTPAPSARPAQQFQPPSFQNIGSQAVKTGFDIATNQIPGVRQLKQVTSAGMGRIADFLSIPSNWAEKKLTGGRGYESTYRNMGITNPVANFGASFGSRLLADPLNFLGVGAVRTGIKGASQASRIPSLLSKASKSGMVKRGVDLARKNPFISNIAEKTFNPYFRNPEAGKIIEGAKEVSMQRVQRLYRQVSEAAQGLSKAQKARVGQLLEGGVSVSAGSAKLRSIAKQFNDLADQVGREAVEQGLLNPESFKNLKGRYMTHIFRTLDNPNVQSSGGVPKIVGDFFKKRTGKEGYIKQFDAPVFKGLGTEMRDIEASKMFKQLGDKFGVDDAVEGFKKGAELSVAKGRDMLKDKFLPPEVMEYINRAGSKRGGFEKFYDSALNAWKAGKTIYNPAYHVRNIVSNQILADMQTGRGIPRTVMDSIKSLRQLKGKGDQRFVNEAADAGVIRRQNFGETVDEFLDEGFNKKNVLSKIHSKVTGFQQGSEDTAKLAVFRAFREKGKSVVEAKRLAEEAIFSPYNLNPSERRILSKIFPFFSFTRQAAPFAAKTLVKNPQRLTKYVKAERSFEKQTEDQAPDERNMPDWMKPTLRTNAKNEKGQTKYFNPQYFYPWGNFMDDESGGLNTALGLGTNPLVEEFVAQKTGEDQFLKRKFVKEGQSDEENIKARLDHAANTFLPNMLYRTPVGKVKPSLEGRTDYAGRERNLSDVALGELLGIKLYPYDPVAGAKSKSYDRYKIQQDYQARVREISRDQEKTPEEKRKLLKDALETYRKRLGD